MARGHAPVAVVLLLAITVLTAGTVAVALPSLSSGPPPKRAIGVDATTDGRVAVTLLSGDAIDVRRAELRVSVGGDALPHQPPVPFFAARGFRGGPTGAFNVAADPTLTVGETATIRLASTNGPLPRVGDTVTVRVLVDGHVVAAAETAVEHTGTTAEAALEHDDSTAETALGHNGLTAEPALERDGSTGETALGLSTVGEPFRPVSPVDWGGGRSSVSSVPLL